MLKMSGPKTYKPSQINFDYLEIIEPRANKTAGYTRKRIGKTAPSAGRIN